MAVINGNLADGKPMQYGAYYNGQAFDGNKLLPAGVDFKGNKVSDEVIAQTNPDNVSYINNQIKANQIQAPVSVPTSSGSQDSLVSSLSANVDKSRAAMESILQKQKEENDKKLAELRAKEQETLTKVGELTTPFREELETAERERLYINENFEANQSLARELDSLLTEGNDLIKQQREVTGLSAIRNPRIQKTMDDVAARAGVIEAVINVRNGQIAQAETLIDRSIGAITADRQDRLKYYETILNLNNRDIISLDATDKRIAEDQVGIAKTFLDSAIETSDYFKQLMINPATASLLGQAGVKLTDTPEQVSVKLANAEYSNEVRDLTNEMATSGAKMITNPSSVASDRLVTLTDSRGQQYYFEKEAKAPTTTDIVNDFMSGLETPTTTTTTTNRSVTTSQKPQFTPSQGVGYIWVDPTTGSMWQFTKSGWTKLL